MIGFIKGFLKENVKDASIIMVGDIGYGVILTNSSVISTGDEIEIFTYTVIREDSQNIFGFYSKEELLLFLDLLEVSGVGPKMARNLISVLGVANICNAVVNKDAAIFKSVSGVGQKNAEKIIIELTGKVEGVAFEEKGDTKDVKEALIGLGYSPISVSKVLQEIDQSLSTGAKIKEGLRLLYQK